MAADETYLRPSIIIQRATFGDEAATVGLTPDKETIHRQGYV
jgi:hypothetical protein